jgi:hypothetical protein
MKMPQGTLKHLRLQASCRGGGGSFGARHHRRRRYGAGQVAIKLIR